MFGKYEAKIQQRINEKLQEQINTLGAKLDELAANTRDVDAAVRTHGIEIRAMKREDAVKNSGRFFEPWNPPVDMRLTFVQQPRGAGKLNAQREAVMRTLCDEYEHTVKVCVCQIGSDCAYIRRLRRKAELDKSQTRSTIPLPKITITPFGPGQERVVCQCGYTSHVNTVPGVNISHRMADAHRAAHAASREKIVESSHE